MAEFDAYTTIEEALDAAAIGLVKKSSDPEGNSVEYYSLTELIQAERRRAAAVAAGKSHMGLRFTKLIPPGTG